MPIVEVSWSMPDARKERHRRYLAYVERFSYFGRRGMHRLEAEEYARLEERLEHGSLEEGEAAELRRLLLKD